MALPLAIPLVMGAIGAGQAIFGTRQANRAQDRFENAQAPSLLDSRAYQTAQTTQNLTGRWAQTGLPEQSLRLQQDMIGRSGAASLASAGSLRQGVAGLGATAQSLGDQYRNLASMDANQRIANRQQYLGARQNVQNIEMEQGQRDYGQFLNQQAMRLAQMSAGRQTASQGLQGITNAAGLGFQASLTPQAFGGWQGPKQRGGTMQPMQSMGAGQIPAGAFNPGFINPFGPQNQMQTLGMTGTSSMQAPFINPFG